MKRWLTFPSPRALGFLTAAAAFCTLVLFVYLQTINAQLAPYGIVPYEFAFTPAQARLMFTSWGAAGQAAARLSLWVDFGFMPAYACFFGGLALLAARGASGRRQTLGLGAAAAPFGALVFDVIENIMLLLALGAPQAPSAAALTVAGLSATIKFSLLLVCLAYLVWAGLARWLPSK